MYEKIGAVFQKSFLFKGNVKSNISFSEDGVDTEKVEQAADTSQSMEFIEKFDEKFDHEIAQLGKNVSGGQKQRLSIARAVYKNQIYSCLMIVFPLLISKQTVNLDIN